MSTPTKQELAKLIYETLAGTDEDAWKRVRTEWTAVSLDGRFDFEVAADAVLKRFADRP